MCLDTRSATDAQCECATRALADTVSPQDAARYDPIAVRFVSNRGTGQAWVGAWNSAVAEVAVYEGLTAGGLQKAVNPLAAVHREAMKSCG